MDDGQTSGPSPSAVAAVSAEAAKILQDPGWARGDPALIAKWDQLYAPLGSGQKEIGDVVHMGTAPPQDGETPDAAAAHEFDALTVGVLQNDWGADHEKNFADAGSAVHLLVPSHDTTFREMDSTLRKEFGPKGVAIMVKAMADIMKSKQGG